MFHIIRWSWDCNTPSRRCMIVHILYPEGIFEWVTWETWGTGGTKLEYCLVGNLNRDRPRLLSADLKGDWWNITPQFIENYTCYWLFSNLCKRIPKHLLWLSCQPLLLLTSFPRRQVPLEQIYWVWKESLIWQGFSARLHFWIGRVNLFQKESCFNLHHIC